MTKIMGDIMVTKIEKEEKTELLNAAKKVDNVWGFLSILSVILRKNAILLFVILPSIGLNIGLLAKYTKVFETLFKAALSVFGIGGK
jgi:hypothetical protein